MNQLESRIGALEGKPSGRAQAETLKQKLAGFRRTLAQTKERIKERIAAGTQCAEAREDVQKVFAEAQRRALGDNNQKTKRFSRQLAAKWRASTVKHNHEIGEVKKILRQCEKCFAGGE